MTVDFKTGVPKSGNEIEMNPVTDRPMDPFVVDMNRAEGAKIANDAYGPAGYIPENIVKFMKKKGLM